MCRSELQVYTKMKTDEIVNLNNTISRLKKQLENYEAESYAQETKKDYSLQVASQKTLEYGQVRSSDAQNFGSFYTVQLPALIAMPKLRKAYHPHANYPNAHLQ